MIRQKHILAVGRILVVLLLAANSGFTLALHSCLMSQMACCADSMPSDRDHATDPALAAPAAQCCAVTVAGGVNTNPIATERFQSTDLQKYGGVALVPAVAALAPVQAPASSRFSSLASGRAAPPSVEKYLLNSTFLI
jgi:hypothetical protein